MKSVFGVCLGASTVSFVKASAEDGGKAVIDHSVSITHNGDPKQVFKDNLLKLNSEGLPVVVTGRKFRNLVSTSQISEPEALEHAIEHIVNKGDDFKAVASLGGETFMVYTLDHNHKISNVITKNQCASGTGEFFLQQIKRMDLNLDEIVETASGAQPYKVSGRCSVFCKSDCTHALNKGIPQPEVTSGLAMMMADKVEELLKKTSNGKILIIGGVTKNKAVMDFLHSKLNGNLVVPESAPHFEALGAALYGLKNDVDDLKDINSVFIKKASSFVFHEPLKKFEHLVDFRNAENSKANDGDDCIIGLDVGSTTTKAIVLRIADNAVLASVYLYTLGNPIRASRNCYSELGKQIDKEINIIGLGVTGSGRYIAGLHGMTNGVFNEIVAHASAAVHFDSEVDTIFEIGGQDAKYTHIINKVPADYAMNEACSAGTGSFIEEAAFESLGIKVQDIEPIAMKGVLPPNFSDQCSAFISSDIKTALQENLSKEDIVAGLVYSICLNYVNRVKGSRPVGTKIFMQGGVCYNKAIPIAMAALTGKEIIVPPNPGLMGAFGVALQVKEKISLGILQPSEFSLADLASREVSYRDPFVCRGGKEKCDLKCSINLIEVEGKPYPFGGACNKYYNSNAKKRIDKDKFDLVKIRHDLTYHKYAPAAELSPNAKTIGINNSFHTHTIYPLYYNFFTKLGYKVVLSDAPDSDGLEREMTSFCYPGQLSLCLFQDLLRKDPDYYFLPSLTEMHVEEEEYYRIDYNATCVFVITEPFFLKQAFKDYGIDDKVICPSLNFASGFGAEEQKFIEIGRKIGETDINKIKQAYSYAVEMQNSYTEELFATGKKLLEFLEQNPDEIGMVIIGRPYNSFTDDANKGIPQKFASRGVYVIPYDMLDYRGIAVDHEMYWEGGKKILKSAKLVKNHPQLFATYISNFSCGPDSMIVPSFRNLMGTKPSLTLELDGHTADAGINTRIDAALDIIANYRIMSASISDIDYSDFRMAKVDLDSEIGVFVDSDGKRTKLNSSDIEILVPSMGDLTGMFFAASLKAHGFNAIALPEGNADILKYGRSYTTGKECLPVILLAGSMVDYIENRWDGNKKVAFLNVSSSGNCRIGQYPIVLRDIVKKKRLRNVAPFELQSDNGYAGFGENFAMTAAHGLFISDVLDDIRSAILAHSVDPDAGLEIFNEELSKILENFSQTLDENYKALEIFSENIRHRIPAAKHIDEAKYIALLGEIYVRRDGFAHKWLNKKFAQKGFVVKTAHVTEWLYYIDYLLKYNLIEPDKSLKDKLERFVRSYFMHSAEKKTKKILAKSGYYKYSRTVIEPLLDATKHIFPLEIKGESALTLGAALHETLEEFCGVINIGPFGCMPTRFSEAVAAPEMTVEGKLKSIRHHNPSYTLPELYNGNMNIPFLTIETDGNVYPQVIEARLETFALQAERIAGLMKQVRDSNESPRPGNIIRKSIFNSEMNTKREISEL